VLCWYFQSLTLIILTDCRLAAMLAMKQRLEELNIPTVLIKVFDKTNYQSNRVHQAKMTPYTGIPTTSEIASDVNYVNAMTSLQSWIPGGILSLVTDFHDHMSSTSTSVLRSLADETDMLVLSLNCHVMIDSNIVGSSNIEGLCEQAGGVIDCDGSDVHVKQLHSLRCLLSNVCAFNEACDRVPTNIPIRWELQVCMSCLLMRLYSNWIVK